MGRNLGEGNGLVRSCGLILTLSALGLAAAGAALARIRDLNPAEDTSGVVLVSVLSRASLAAFRAEGFEAYLVKPVRPASVLKQLSSPARRRRLSLP